MELRDYLHKKGISLEVFGEMVFCHHGHIGSISRGAVKASHRLAKLIELVTEGEVTAEEVLQQKRVRKYVLASSEKKKV